MDNYNAAADFLNKFSQLTPWVQVALGGFICGMVSTLGFFLKEIVRVITDRVKRGNA
jgi:hypothetical protein